MVLLFFCQFYPFAIIHCIFSGLLSDFGTIGQRRTKSPAEARPADDCMDSPFAMNAVVKVPPVKQEAHVLACPLGYL